MRNAQLRLGTTDRGEPFQIAASVLLRHAMALGSSGSGKTVLCKSIVEEALAQGIPAICIDPQGDLCSLAGAIDPEMLAEHGIDPEVARAFADRIDPVIFTPGSTRGIPLCADPIDPSIRDPESIARTAAITASLLGFDLDSDDGAGLVAVIDRALTARIERGEAPSLSKLGDGLADPAHASLLDPRKIKIATQRLARLEVGARRAMFHGGVPIDIDVLLGRDSRCPVPKGKTRLAIVYLNTLGQQDDKDFFVAALADRLYAWMLAHPQTEPQLLFYLDEVAPFIPPVRKPACKEGLALLFKQARKYGVCCVMATQNPGDVDYRAMAQFGTWALGRLSTRQDLKKVEPTLKALAPAHADDLAQRIGALTPGRFVMLSPDALPAPIEIASRWLMTPHETWDEARIAAFSSGIRDRFESLTAPIELTAPKKKKAAKPEPQDDAPIADALRTIDSSTTRELATKTGRSESSVRRTLERMKDSGEARTYREGRSQRWFSPVRGARPDLGLPARVATIVAKIDVERAKELAKEHVRTRLFGLIGDDETLDAIEPVWRLLYRLEFEEKVERPLIGRLFGPTHDDRIGSVYVHPHNFGVATFTIDEGIRFVDRPEGPASEIRDFDGVVELIDAPPAQLSIDEDDWRARRKEQEARKSFAARFEATPRAVHAVFVPLWQVLLRSGGGLRRVIIDALVGKPVKWLGPERG